MLSDFGNNHFVVFLRKALSGVGLYYSFDLCSHLERWCPQSSSASRFTDHGGGKRRAVTNLSCLFLIQIDVLCGWAGISFGVVLVREENTMARLGGYQKPYWIIVLGAIIILLLISLTHL